MVSEHHRAMARELLIGSLIALAITNAILGGLTFLMFFLGGVFTVLGWIVIVFWVLWDWRGLRQIFRLIRGDISI